MSFQIDGHCLGLSPGRGVRHDAAYLREEPGAGKPHARICEGESQMAELLDHYSKNSNPLSSSRESVSLGK